MLQDSIFPADGPVPLDATAAAVSFSPKSFTVNPGQTQTVTVSITPPKGLDAKTFPVFSGFIELANGNERFQVTYLGLANSLKNMPVVDNTNVFFGVNLPTMVDPDGNFFSTPENFTFVDDDSPSVLLRLNFGTSTLRFDLVDSNIKLNTTLNTREVEETETHVFERSVFSFPHNPGQGTFAKVKILGTLFEADFQPRNSDQDVSGRIASLQRRCADTNDVYAGRHWVQRALDPDPAVRERDYDPERLVSHPSSRAEGYR